MISVIIATYNRSEDLKRVLDCLGKQEIPVDLKHEIIIVDNNSKDNTKAMMESLIPAFQGKLKYLFEPVQGKVFALNRAIKEAQGNIIAFTDDDCMVDQDYLMKIEKAFKEENGPIGVVGGKITPRWVNGEAPVWIKQFCSCFQVNDIPWSGDDKPKWLNQFFQGPLGILDYGNEPFMIDHAHKIHKDDLFYGANIAIRKDLLDQYGYFHTAKKVTEDTEICLRLFQAGVKGFYAPQIIVHHKIDARKITPEYFYRWWYGHGVYLELDKSFKQKHFYQPWGIPIRFIRDSFKWFIKSIFTRSLYQKVYYRSMANFAYGQIIQIIKKKEQ